MQSEATFSRLSVTTAPFLTAARKLLDVSEKLTLDLFHSVTCRLAEAFIQSIPSVNIVNNLNLYIFCIFLYNITAHHTRQLSLNVAAVWK